MGGQPADAYSLTVSDVRACHGRETLTSFWEHEQHQQVRRIYHDQSWRNARTSTMTASSSKRLRICDWGGVAEHTRMRHANDIGKWFWHGRDENVSDGAALLSDDSSILGDDIDDDSSLPDLCDSDSNGDPILSDSDDDNSELCAEGVLRTWGVAEPAGDIPVLLVPEAVLFLIMNRQWQHIVILARWHDTLVNQLGQSLWKSKVLWDSWEIVGWLYNVGFYNCVDNSD